MFAEAAALLVILAISIASALLPLSAISIFRNDRAKGPGTRVWTGLTIAACIFLLVPTALVGVGLIGSVGIGDDLDTPWSPVLTYAAALGFLLLPLAGLTFGLVRPRIGGLLLLALSALLPIALMTVGLLLISSTSATPDDSSEDAWGIALLGATIAYVVAISLPTAIAGILLLMDHGRRQRRPSAVGTDAGVD